ncbi:hypothetical protein FQA39_LY19172 [Lamprigera yunnana]|nr:hypothetical protein FQA39_LY19172 [Lamprigera yunnana]
MNFPMNFVIDDFGARSCNFCRRIGRENPLRSKQLCGIEDEDGELAECLLHAQIGRHSDLLASKTGNEGKGLLFKIFLRQSNVFDIEIDDKDPEIFIQTVKANFTHFGGINLEGYKRPQKHSKIERRLKEELDNSRDARRPARNGKSFQPPL